MSKGEKSLKLIDKNDLISTRKFVFSFLGPAGVALDELFFERYGRIKQERVNSFVESFLDYLNLKKINLSDVNTEHFGDIFELIIRKVSQTKSKEKIERFKDILTQQIVNPNYEDFITIYIDLIGKLSEAQIAILFEHYNERKRTPSVKGDTNFDYIREPSFFSLGDGEYIFYTQDLNSKGLLYNSGSTYATDDSGVNLQGMHITEFGIEFLKFIKRY